MQLFGTKGQKFHHCPGTKGQAKSQGTRQDGRDSQNPGQDGPGQSKSKKGCGTIQYRAEEDVLKQEKDALEQKRTF